MGHEGPRRRGVPDRLSRTVAIADGGLATSSVTVRRWRAGGETRHHIVDLRSAVPLSSHWAPLWVGLGALAVDLLAAVVVTSLVPRRLKHRTWRTIHWAAYAAWPIAYLHGLGAGTDAATSWMLGVDVACLSTVGAALGRRLSGPSSMAGWPSPPKSSSSSTAAS